MANTLPNKIRTGNDVEFIITLTREDGAAQNFLELSMPNVSVFSTAQHITAGSCELEPLSPSDPYTLRAFYRVSQPQFLGPVEVALSGSLDGHAFTLSSSWPPAQKRAAHVLQRYGYFTTWIIQPEKILCL